MEQWVQFSINIAIALLGIFIGRVWQRNDTQIKKDRELIENILNLIPVDSNSINFLRTHDFGSSYRGENTKPFWELRRFLIQPNSFFINNQLEKKRKELCAELYEFKSLFADEIFPSRGEKNIGN